MTDWLAKRGINCSGPEGSVCTFSGKFIGDLSGNINGNVKGSVGSIAGGNYYQTPFVFKESDVGCPASYPTPVPEDLSESSIAYLNFIAGSSSNHQQINLANFCSNLPSFLIPANQNAIIQRLPWPVGDCKQDTTGQISCPH